MALKQIWKLALSLGTLLLVLSTALAIGCSNSKNGNNSSNYPYPPYYPTPQDFNIYQQSCGQYAQMGFPACGPINNVWVGQLQITNSGNYKNFLRAMRICDLNQSWLFLGFDLGTYDCDSWDSQGVIYIEAMQPTVPTQGAITIVPTLTGGGYYWGGGMSGAPIRFQGAFVPSANNTMFQFTSTGGMNFQTGTYGSFAWNNTIGVSGKGNLNQPQIEVVFSYSGQEAGRSMVTKPGPYQY